MLSHLRNTVKPDKKPKAKGKPFNPNFDGNLLAWYDGDTLNTDPAGTWSDRSANGFDLTLFNNPTIVNNAINGHDAIQFDGINQYGQRVDAAMILTQPITYYLVVKQIVINANDWIISSPFTLNYVENAGNMQANAGAGLILNPQPIVNTYDLITIVYNGLNGEVRTNNNVAVTGNIGVNVSTGILLATNLGTFVNCELAYIIIRSAADNTATQNLFINFLKNRFAL